MSNCNDTGLLIQNIIQSFKHEMTAVINRQNPENSTLAPAHHLPWNYV